MSIGSDTFHSVKQTLLQFKSNARCSKVTKLVEKLGFTVDDKGNAGHKVIFHDHISDFYSSSFNCGHGRNPEIKPVYIKNLVKLLEKYESDIINFLDDYSS